MMGKKATVTVKKETSYSEKKKNPQIASTFNISLYLKNKGKDD